MHIKEIRINGFKSFADKITLELDKTFTGIVGPNGSGKSNIVDAIKWVLGEQSVKTLRGSASMTDVIFSGSKSRDVKNAASVSLLFDNTDKTLKIDYDEVLVKRILYKTGDNEYYLNGTRCRLKDITDLFIDSFNSKDGINIIAQGKVSELLNNKPTDNRIILEDAAGILKYKLRKEESLRKLSKTHENLSRINMIISELESQVKPLEEQSIKAKKYNEIKEKLTNVDIALMCYDISNINLNYEENKKKITNLKENLSITSTEVTKEESEVESLKLKLIKLEEKETKYRIELNKINSELQEATSKKELLIERNKYDKNSDEIKNNLIKLKEDELKLKNEIESLKRAIEIKKEEESSLTLDLKKLETDNNVLSTRIDVLRSEWQEKSKEELINKNRKDILENNISNNELLPFSVKTILNNNFKGVHDVVNSIIKYDSIYASVINVALGAGANNIIVDDEEIAKKCIKYLKENKKGRCTFLPITTIKPKSIDPSIYEKIKDIDGIIDVASHLVETKDVYKNIINNLLGNIIVCKDISAGVILSKEIYSRYKIVTMDGDVINIGGSLTGGSIKETTSIVSMQYELDKINTILNNLKNRKEEITKEEKELEFKQTSLKDAIYKSNLDLINLKEFIWNRSSLLDEDEKSYIKLKQEIEDLTNSSKERIDKNLNSTMDEYYKLVNDKNELDLNINNIEKNIKDIKDTINDKELIIKKSNAVNKNTVEEINALEISLAKSSMTLDNLLVRLNEEYSVTFESAKKEYILDIDEKDARILVNDLKRDLKIIGPVNLNSIEDFERINKRYEFLISQREDLNKSEMNILEVIKNMDDIVIDKFATTFNKVNKEFNKVFKVLFGGGEASLKLTDPTNILETGIEIIAFPPGKKPASITLLSGGEKTLTAISLLFAIMNLKELPFVVLDEVESALDEANVDRFGSYLSNYKGKTQLLIITHKKKTMEYVDLLYGITMEESGVSKLVSVKLEEVK